MNLYESYRKKLKETDYDEEARKRYEERVYNRDEYIEILNKYLKPFKIKATLIQPPEDTFMNNCIVAIKLTDEVTGYSFEKIPCNYIPQAQTWINIYADIMAESIIKYRYDIEYEEELKSKQLKQASKLEKAFKSFKKEIDSSLLRDIDY